MSILPLSIRTLLKPTAPRQSQRPVLFVHIPKTGGTTLRSVLQETYGDGYHYCQDPRLDRIKADIERYKCLQIHPAVFEGRSVWPHRELFEERNWPLLKRCDFFVIFRNPTDQAISLYLYVMQHFANLPPAQLAAAGMPIPKTFDEYFAGPDALNMQLAFLLGKSQLATGARLTEKDLEVGKRLLSELDVKVGILERFAESLSLFEAFTSRRVPSRRIEVLNKMVDPSRLAEIDDEARAFIRAGNSLDEQLYQHALGLFDEQLARWNVAPTPLFRFA
jgi:hypothetical protein